MLRPIGLQGSFLFAATVLTVALHGTGSIWIEILDRMTGRTSLRARSNLRQANVADAYAQDDMPR